MVSYRTASGEMRHCRERKRSMKAKPNAASQQCGITLFAVRCANASRYHGENENGIIKP